MAGRDIDGESADAVVELRWDDYNTGLFAKKLIRHVRRGELAFDLEARPGSLETTYAVAAAEGMTVEVIESIARYLYRRESLVERHLPDPEVVVFVDGTERGVTVSEEADVRTLVRCARAIIRDEDQRNLDDFNR